MTIEICVDSVGSAIAAQDGGADRVELCDNLTDGGTTPSFAAIEKARELLNIKLHVIIRPRGGDFLYSDLEFEIMRRDVEIARSLGADGIVIGILDANGDVDTQRTRELAELARPMSVTFHRAFDVCRDWRDSLQKLIDIGIDRILTSGQTALAADGIDTLTEIIRAAGTEIKIMVCGWLRPGNIAQIAAATNAKEFHFTAFSEKESLMKYRNENVPMGGTPPMSEFVRNETDPEIVKLAIDALKG